MSYQEFPTISLKMLIDAQILKAGSKLHAESDENVSALLNEDGSISLTVDNQPKEYQSPSAAAKAVTKKSVNGWIFWKLDDSGQMNTLSFFRSKYSK